MVRRNAFSTAADFFLQAICSSQTVCIAVACSKRNLLSGSESKSDLPMERRHAWRARVLRAERLRSGRRGALARTWYA